MIIKYSTCIIIAVILAGCKQTSVKDIPKESETNKSEKLISISNEQYLETHSDSCGCAAQYDLKDSAQIDRVKNQFYKSKTGHLYERTVALKEVNGNLVEVEYFNGKFSQDVDPITFVPLNGWYAKDKKNVYYYRPVSGGMHISNIENADVNTFAILKGHYKYASDKNHFYNESEIIEGFIPSKTILMLDGEQHIIEIICNKKAFKFELVKD